MAFTDQSFQTYSDLGVNLADYFESHGTNVPKTEEGILAVANAIGTAAQEGLQFASNVDYENWATAAKQAIEDGDLDTAYAYITGQKSSKAEKIWKTYLTQKQSVQQKLEDLMAGVANQADFSGINPATNQPFTDAEKQVLYADSEYQQKLKDISYYQGMAQVFNVPVDQSSLVVKDAGGNYIPASEVTTSRETQGRTGEALGARQAADGTWEVYGTQTGEVYSSGLASAADALTKQNELNTGSTPSLTGIPETLATPETTAAFQAGTLPEQLSAVSSQLESSVSAAESAALAEDPALEITDEMRAEWLKQAIDELDPYYSEIIKNYETELGTSLSRLVEDVQYEVALQKQEYQQELVSKQAELQSKGMLYGSYRTKEEEDLATARNLELERLGTEFTRSLQDTSLEAEKYLGSDLSKTLGSTYGTTESVGRVLAGEPTYTSGDTTNLFQYSGGYTGSLQQEKTEEEQARTLEVENEFRNLNSSTYA